MATTDEPSDAVTLARPAAPYASGDRVAERYHVVEAFGTGPLGTTYRARDREGNAVAVKVVTQALLPTSADRDAFVAALSQLKGRNFQRVAMPVEVGVDAGDVVFVVTRWVYGASLRRVLRAFRAAEKKLDPEQALGVLQGVATALRELHTASSHGALYPESVQITADGVVLTDPALAASAPSKHLVAHMARFPDALAYLSPEVRAGRRCNAGADLYSLGALASELLYGDAAATTVAKTRLPDTPQELEDALRALVSDQAPKRAAALPLTLERLLRVAGHASLPAYAALPKPAPAGEARTRRLPSMGPAAAPRAIGPVAPLVPRAKKPR